MAPCLRIFNVTSLIDDILVKNDMQSCCKELPKIQSGLNTKPNGLFSLCNILKELVKSLKFFQPQPFNRIISKKCGVKLSMPLFTPQVDCKLLEIKLKK
ncbi:hypothetical protein Hanom_Chr16g01458951 [Helianthus anomalus]